MFGNKFDYLGETLGRTSHIIVGKYPVSHNDITMNHLEAPKYHIAIIKRTSLTQPKKNEHFWKTGTLTHIFVLSLFCFLVGGYPRSLEGGGVDLFLLL